MKCTLLDQISKTDSFLRNNKNGLSYTPDAREATLQPFSEVVRLNIDTQAIGYLNMYELTNEPMLKQQYLQEATARLDYIVSLGATALRNAAFDGLVGYSMLRAYRLTNVASYRTLGLKIADACLGYYDTMNTGYMCALALGEAYNLTGNNAYRTAARVVTRNTGDKQFPDGAFPHRDSQFYGENTSYTTWLMIEMLMYRRLDPTNPDIDYALIKATNFLEKRVNADGSINYQDADGSYYSDPGNADGRGGMADPAGIADVLYASGKEESAMRALQFLFQHQLTGAQLGSYPDKWEYIDPANPWTTGNPSVIRTSLIFWYLTETLRTQHGAVSNGTRQDCNITPDNCHAAYDEIGVCSAGLVGHMTTIDGVTTKCLNEDLVNYKPEICIVRWRCAYDERDDMSDVDKCTNWANIKCIGSACGSFCLAGNSIQGEVCNRSLEQGDLCTNPPPAH